MPKPPKKPREPQDEDDGPFGQAHDDPPPPVDRPLFEDEPPQDVPAAPIARVILAPQPPSNVDYPQVTVGIARNMQADPVTLRNIPAPDTQGGGDLNGSANEAHLIGQAGTDAGQLQLPRANLKVGGGNYCGIV